MYKWEVSTIRVEGEDCLLASEKVLWIFLLIDAIASLGSFCQSEGKTNASYFLFALPGQKDLQPKASERISLHWAKHTFCKTSHLV